MPNYTSNVLHSIEGPMAGDVVCATEIDIPSLGNDGVRFVRCENGKFLPMSVPDGSSGRQMKACKHTFNVCNNSGPVSNITVNASLMNPMVFTLHQIVPISLDCK